MITGEREDGSGKKHDAGKARWDLVPYDALEEVVRVLMFGANEYGEWNWMQLRGWRTRYFAAAMRHLLAWFRGERRDPKTGLHHLAHAAVNCLFLISKDMENEAHEREPFDALKESYNEQRVEKERIEKAASMAKSALLAGQLAVQKEIDNAATALREGRHADFVKHASKAVDAVHTMHPSLACTDAWEGKL